MSIKEKPIDRVKKFIDFKELSISGFEKATKLSNNSIQTAIKRRSNLKDETLNSILNRFPELDAAWLLTGRGKMLVEGEQKKAPEESEPVLDNINKKLDKALAYLVRLDMDSNEIKEGVSDTYKEVLKQK